jgi:hypothetical protein
MVVSRFHGSKDEVNRNKESTARFIDATEAWPLRERTDGMKKVAAVLVAHPFATKSKMILPAGLLLCEQVFYQI